MSILDPVTIPTGELWKVTFPNSAPGRWLGVRLNYEGDTYWFTANIDRAVQGSPQDLNIVPLHEVGEDGLEDPVVFSIRQSEVEQLEAYRDEIGDWVIKGQEAHFFASGDETEEDMNHRIRTLTRFDVTRLLAVRDAIKAENENPVLTALLRAAPEGDRETLAQLAENPEIIAALGGVQYE